MSKVINTSKLTVQEKYRAIFFERIVFQLIIN